MKVPKNLVIKEQSINSCSKELSVHPHEKAPEILKEIAKIADQYLGAHGKHVFSPVCGNQPAHPDKDENRTFGSGSTQLHCCNGRGHGAVNCPTVMKCCLVGKPGHDAQNCRATGLWSGG